jgi:16S rRNA U516 pseudouridylate synthase RsuA-like enzyme
MCEAIGHPVDHLRRVAIGPIKDAKLKIGAWRDLTDNEIARLRRGAIGDKSTKGKRGHKPERSA